MPRIGQYEIEGELGRGGMGVVLRARAPDGREVALKVLAGSGDAQAFERERRLLSELGESQGFVPLLDSGTDGARRFFVMPLLPGGTLATRLARGPLKVEDAIRLGSRLASALACAHERGIVHRDLKPSNVLFTREGAPLVSDLGLAKHFARDADGASRSATATGTLGGTVGYMAPEQLEDVKSVGPSCDVFALGVVLYECLAGARPFAGEGILSYAGSLARAPRPLRALRADVPSWLERAIMRSIERDRTRRFSDARELLRVFEAHGSRPASHRGVKLALAALVLAGGGAALFLRERASPVAVPAPVAPVASATRPAPRSHLALAREARAARDLGRALAEAQLANFESPDDSAVKAEIRSILGEKPPVESAIAILDRLVRADAKNVAAIFARGSLRALVGDFEGEKADELVATKLSPGSGIAWAFLAQSRLALEEAEEAEHDAARAIALDSKVPMGWAYRATARLGRKDALGTIADMTRAIDITPQFPPYLDFRAQARLQVGDLLGALRDLKRELELDGALDLRSSIASLEARVPRGDRDAARALADASLQAAGAGDVGVALERGEEAVKADPSCARAWCALANARQIQGASEDAIVHATRALEEEGGADEPGAWFVRGKARLGTEDLEGALSDLERAVERGAGAPALAVRAQVHFRLGAVALAVADAEEATRRAESGDARRFYEVELEQMRGSISAYPKEVSAPSRHLRLARAARAAKDLPGALAEVVLASIECPEDPRVVLEFFAVKGENPPRDQALAALGDLIEREPRNARALAERGELLLEEGAEARALADEREAIELDPSLARPWIVIASTEARSGDEEGAERDITRAIERSPLNALAWGARATLRHEKGDEAGAIADATRAIELGGGNAGTRQLRADARERMGDLAGALADLRKALGAVAIGDVARLRRRIGQLEARLGPSDRATSDELARASSEALSQGDLEGALALARKAVDAAPGSEAAWAELTKAHVKAGRFTLAIVCATRIIEEGPDHGEGWMLRGYARIETGDLEGALSDADRALRIQPRGVSPHRIKARAWHARHEPVRAIEELETVLGLTPPDDRSRPGIVTELETLKAEAARR